MPEKTILITGATGYVGRRLCQRLLQGDRYKLKLLVRNRRKVQAAVAEQVEIIEGSTFEQKPLHRAAEGVDTAFYLIHSMGAKKDFRDLDRKSAENFRDACIAKGVRRIVYLGGLGVKKSASTHLLSRIETGEVLAYYPEKIQVIWIRAGAIIGSGSASFEIIRNLSQKLPVMITPKWVRTKTEPIGIDDVLSYLEDSIELEEKKEVLLVDIGAERLSFAEMMQQASEEMGLKRYLIPVPVLTPRLSSYWLILFTPLPYSLVEALVAGLKSETVVQNDNARRSFPHITPVSFRKAVRKANSELQNQQVISRWCDSSGDTACDVKDFDNPEGAVLRDVRIVSYEHGESQKQVFQAACELGGPRGWFKYNLLWRIRGFIDKLSGGYGLSRGRRLHRELRVGDALDFWKVADIREGKRLLLFAQMKLPGRAWLEFDCQPNQLVQTAHFIPRGVLGRIYWYSVAPFHTLVFQNLAETVVKESRKLPQKATDREEEITS